MKQNKIDRMMYQEELINDLLELWIKRPEWRLGQLIFNLTQQYDCFYVQDEDLEECINKLK